MASFDAGRPAFASARLYMRKLNCTRLVAVALLLALPACGGGPTREEFLRSQREYDLGVGLFQEQNMAGAYEHLLEAIELDADNAEAHFLLGNLFMIHRHDFERSERHFREALRANEAAPTRSGLAADVRNAIGVLFIHARRYEDATEVLRESASDLMNHEPAVAWTNLGWAYYELERYPRALEVLTQAVQLQPQMCMAWYRTGQVHVAQDQWTAAEAALTRGLDVEDETCQRLQVSWRLRGEVRARLGHRDEAIRDLERCVELAPETEDGQACRRLLGGSMTSGDDAGGDDASQPEASQPEPAGEGAEVARPDPERPPQIAAPPAE